MSTQNIAQPIVDCITASPFVTLEARFVGAFIEATYTAKEPENNVYNSFLFCFYMLFCIGVRGVFQVATTLQGALHLNHGTDFNTA